MSKLHERNRDFIARYCAHWDDRIAVSRDASTGRWTVKAGVNSSADRVATNRSHDEAFRLLAIKLHAGLIADNQKLINVMAKKVTKNQAIIGDWSEDR